MAKRIEIGLVEDNSRTLERFIHVISKNPEWHIQFAVRNLAHAREALAWRRPDVVLLDLGLPDGDGYELISDIVSRYADCQILVISVFGDEQNILRCIEAGATGYLLKGQGDDELAEHLQDLLNGGSPMSPQIARYVLQKLRLQKPTAATPHPTVADTAMTGSVVDATAYQELTIKEMEILRDLALGHSYNEVANRMQISLNTVRHHVKSIYSKLYVRSRTQAVNTAQLLGLLDRL